MNLTVKNKIIKILNKAKMRSVEILDETDLLQDLRIDSLAFIKVLLEIENAFSITFEITEMENCLMFKNLIDTVQNKLKEA